MLRDIVVNLLHNLGGRSEVDRYLSEYAEGKRCTVVKVGGGLIDKSLNAGLVHGIPLNKNESVACTDFSEHFLGLFRVSGHYSDGSAFR